MHVGKAIARIGVPRVMSGHEILRVSTLCTTKFQKPTNRMLPTDCHVLVAERDVHVNP